MFFPDFSPGISTPVGKVGVMFRCSSAAVVRLKATHSRSLREKINHLGGRNCRVAHWSFLTGHAWPPDDPEPKLLPRADPEGDVDPFGLERSVCQALPVLQQLPERQTGSDTASPSFLWATVSIRVTNAPPPPRRPFSQAARVAHLLFKDCFQFSSCKLLMVHLFSSCLTLQDHPASCYLDAREPSSTSCSSPQCPFFRRTGAPHCAPTDEAGLPPDQTGFLSGFLSASTNHWSFIYTRTQLKVCSQ